MKAYPAELRTRIVDAVDAGLAPCEAARLFAVSERTIRRYRIQQRQTHDLTPKSSPGRPPRIGAEYAARLRAQVAAQPDATLAQHCAVWEQEHGVSVTIATMSRAIHRLGITLKKSPVRGGAR
jgi:transposase